MAVPQKAPVAHALRALRIVLLCLPDVHLTMVHEVHEQLRALVPDFAITNAIPGWRQCDCTPMKNRIWDTDPRTCASKAEARQDSKIFRSALQVVPRIIRSFCESGAVSLCRMHTKRFVVSCPTVSNC